MEISRGVIRTKDLKSGFESESTPFSVNLNLENIGIIGISAITNIGVSAYRQNCHIGTSLIFITWKMVVPFNTSMCWMRDGLKFTHGYLHVNSETLRPGSLWNLTLSSWLAELFSWCSPKYFSCSLYLFWYLPFPSTCGNLLPELKSAVKCTISCWRFGIIHNWACANKSHCF